MNLASAMIHLFRSRVLLRRALHSILTRTSEPVRTGFCTAARPYHLPSTLGSCFDACKMGQNSLGLNLWSSQQVTLQAQSFPCLGLHQQSAPHFQNSLATHSTWFMATSLVNIRMNAQPLGNECRCAKVDRRDSKFCISYFGIFQVFKF
jgi:hypothetical protein